MMNSHEWNKLLENIHRALCTLELDYYIALNHLNDVKYAYQKKEMELLVKRELQMDMETIFTQLDIVELQKECNLKKKLWDEKKMRLQHIEKMAEAVAI